MKKLSIFILAFLFVMGLALGVGAAPYVWVDASPTAHAGDGIPDTSLILNPSEVVWLDVYVSNLADIPNFSQFGLQGWGV